MTEYKKVKVTTLKKRHLPCCGNCSKWFMEHKDGTYSYTPQCEDDIKDKEPEIWQHYGAGCPNFAVK